MSANTILFVAAVLGALGFFCYTLVSVIRLFQIKKQTKEMNEFETKMRKVQSDMGAIIDRANKQGSQEKDHH